MMWDRAMTAANVGATAQNILKNPNLLRDSAVGGMIGMLVRSPVLGALGGAAYNLFKAPGMAEGMRSVAQDALGGLRTEGGVQGALDVLGKSLFGGTAGRTRPDPERAKVGAAAAEKKSGIPGWAKWLGLGGGALMLSNALFDNFSMNGFGNPLFGGYGMHPFMDPMAGMMDPMGMGMGMGMAPTLNLLGGMGLTDLLLAGGVGYAGYKLLTR